MRDLLEVDANDRAAALTKRGEVTVGLGADEPGEAEGPAGNRKLVAGIVHDLDEAPGRRSALVQLAGRVQVPRTEAVRDHAARLARPRDQGLELGFAGRVDESLDADVVRGRGSREQVVQVGPGLGYRRDPLAGENLVRPVLRLLDVRLVERIDADDRAGHGRGELPAVELLAELVGVRNARLLGLPVRPVRRLADRHRHETFALLAGRLRDQLLDPEPEAARNRADLHLVASVLPPVAEALAELEPGIALVETACVHHLLDSQEEALEVDTHERGGDHPEDGQRRIAAADRRLPGEDAAEAALAREWLELRAGVGDRREGFAPPAGALPEEVEMAARLERRAGLRRDDEQRPLGVEPVGQPPDRSRVGRVEHLEELAPERAPEHLRREARPAHAEEDDRVEAAGRSGDELLQLADPLEDAQRLVQPAEPAVLVTTGPQRRVASPEALDKLRGVERSQRPTRPRARRTWRECPRGARRTSRRTSGRPPARASR